MNQPIPDNSTNIVSINDSDGFIATEKILASPVHSLVYASPKFTYGNASDPLSPLYDSLEESVTPRVISKPRDNLPNLFCTS